MKQSFTKNINTAAVAEGIIREAERAELLEILARLKENQEKVQRDCIRINKILLTNKRL
jgi:hypothetical protein|tara:strand:+ start:741 stop:917 length:177 start_codon:yes stop_codon:yes gene_type:complete